MRYYSILLLLSALSLGIFGCEPEVRNDTPITEEIVVDKASEEPVVEIEPAEVKVKPVETAIKDNKTEKAVNEAVETEPEKITVEPVTDPVIAEDEKPAKEDVESDTGMADTTEKTSGSEKTTDSEKTTEEPKKPAPPVVDEKPKEQAPEKKEKDSRPRLVDTKFFENCDYVFKNFVDKDGMVNYRRLRLKKQELLTAVRELGNLPMEIRPLWSKNDEKAFLLNAHNILMIHLVIENYPIKPSRLWSLMFPANSIKQIPGAREKKFFRVAGFSYTLDELEVLLLNTTKDPETKLMDPRYCFALSNATMMGGKLLNEAYHPDKLDKQIDKQVSKYLDDPQNLMIDTNEKKIHLSSMFRMKNIKKSLLNSRYASIKRFREKKPEIRAFLNFIFENIDKKKAKELESRGYEVDPRTYDWKLNERELK